MHIVRVNHTNGLYLDFLFLDPGRASACAQECATAKSRGTVRPGKDALVEVRDDAGRVTWLDGALLATVQLVPLEDEVRANTRMKLVVEETARQYLAQMGVPEQPAPRTNGAAVSASPAGGIGTFSG